MIPLELAGRTFGRLTAIRVVRVKKTRQWLFRCECGESKIASGSTVSRGLLKSCGCFRADTAKARLLRHGHSGKTTGVSRIYELWKGMRRRCQSIGSKSYPNYGGRGIKVCERWQKFENFLEDMGERPDGTSLDRINNDGDYEPSNCRWATKEEQANNSRQNVRLEWRGETKTVAQWARSTGITEECIRGRIKAGWNADRTLTRPSARPTP